MTRTAHLGAFLLLTCAYASAQVQVRFSPEPMEVLKALNVKKIGIWSVMMCSDYARLVSLPPERVMMTAGGLHVIAPTRALAVLAHRRATSVRSVVMEGIEYGLIGASVFGGGGFIAMSSKTFGALATATGLAHSIQDRVKTRLPDLGPYTESLLTEPVTLGPAECKTRTVFAGLTKNPQPISATVTVPQ